MLPIVFEAAQFLKIEIALHTAHIVHFACQARHMVLSSISVASIAVTNLESRKDADELSRIQFWAI
jgi:hypothetical protein